MNEAFNPAAELSLGVPAARAKLIPQTRLDRKYKLRSETSELSRLFQWTNFHVAHSKPPIREDRPVPLR